MSFDRKAAKDAGYTDEEIDAFLAQEKSQPEAAAATMQTAEPPPPTTRVPEISATGTGLAAATAGAAGAVYNVAKDLAVPAAVAYGAKKAYDITQLGKQAVDAYRQNANVNAAREARLQQHPKFGASRVPTAPAAPGYGPTTYNAPTATGPSIPQTAATGPSIPQGAPAAQPAAQPANWMQRAISMAKNAAPALAKAGIATGALTYSAPLGPRVPSRGPLRGSEINPATGMGWTAADLAAYEAQY